MKNTDLSTVFDDVALEEYRRLHLRALDGVRRYGDTRAEADYEAAFSEGLYPLESFIVRKAGAVTEGTERAFAAAAGVTACPTIEDLLGLAAEHFMRINTDDMLSRLGRNGAVVQELLGFILRPDYAGEGLAEKKTGAHPFERKFAPKTKELVSALEGLNVSAEDLVITKTSRVHGALRRGVYTLIDIPKLDLQFAVCDQIGEATFISNTILPVATWASSTKMDLTGMPGVRGVSYDAGGRWIERLLTHIFEGNADPAQAPRVKLPRKSRRPLLTEDTIVRWIRTTHEYNVLQKRSLQSERRTRTSNWPSNTDTDVRDKDEAGNFILLAHEKWSLIETACVQGLRGLKGGDSLAQIKSRHGLNDDLTKEQVIDLMRSTHDYNVEHRIHGSNRGNWPTAYDKDVWSRNAAGEYVLQEDRTWCAIGASCARRGFGTLAALKKEIGTGVAGNGRPLSP